MSAKQSSAQQSDSAAGGSSKSATAPEPSRDPAASKVDGSTPTVGRNIRLVLLLVMGLLAVQIVVLVVSLANRSAVDDLRTRVAALDASGLDSGQVANLGTGASSAAPTSTGSTAGNLPRFLGGGDDAAVGRTLAAVTGLEYYTGSTLTVDPTDGKGRAFIVWAHWCPYCQQELPLLTEWQSANAASLARFELVSVTTAIDDTSDNPLLPYLDESDFSFPVIVDEDGSLARQFGVNAFPFWVFTAPDGTVVGRAAGFVEIDDAAEVFAQLDDMAENGPSAAPSG